MHLLLDTYNGCYFYLTRVPENKVSFISTLSDNNRCRCSRVHINKRALNRSHVISTVRINIANKSIIETILERKKREYMCAQQVDTKGMLKNILSWANQFVPSESGSILFDDPTVKHGKNRSNYLYFVSCFGKGSSKLIGTAIPAETGIVGKVYTSGKPYISKKAREDINFYSAIDKKTQFQTKSIICAPIKINKITIGVIELINRLDQINYNNDDLTLLKIFAEHTSTLLQNSLDAKRFAELSIRDNLTGLYNDRYFYDAITHEVTKAIKKETELSLIFLDLDHFKEVNDTYGHLAGSRLLSEVGVILGSGLKGFSLITSRYGGDEFVCILPGSDTKAATRYAEHLRKTIEEYVFLTRRFRGQKKAIRLSGQITASIGVVSMKHGQKQATVTAVRDTLIRDADKAMYSSKENGRNKVTVTK